ncbi:MAG TPA: GreA/GreB family elongation factor [Steroidobacteraceae bacterium]|nr:GreA/GreB family elongation factor [Steroidobacteraceae bacterium]
MSRAFVRESDQPEPLPERVVSAHPNFVTPAGLQGIADRIRDLEAERDASRESGDEGGLARIARDLRYWNQRRASARVIEAPAHPDVVRFGVRVALRFADGSEQAFRIVGEDEADPAHGFVSWVSPIAAALMGRAAGDTVRYQDHEAEILRIEP